ncbi:hypothetical protein, partial [Psychroflexus aestuariivivens]|uniref:hypothetical protein n=1 Tax=Psychroflexus aestuariivivens TaxID=1795040 RepID=UPI0019603AD8
FVAGKLAIIFQFMILTSRKSQNSDFNSKSAMSDMQCCAMAFYFSNQPKFSFLITSFRFRNYVHFLVFGIKISREFYSHNQF